MAPPWVLQHFSSSACHTVFHQVNYTMQVPMRLHHVHGHSHSHDHFGINVCWTLCYAPSIIIIISLAAAAAVWNQDRTSLGGRSFARNSSEALLFSSTYSPTLPPILARKLTKPNNGDMAECEHELTCHWSDALALKQQHAVATINILLSDAV